MLHNKGKSSMIIGREDWIWFIIVDRNGDFEHGFNSQAGAESWLETLEEEDGYTIIPVKEVTK